MATYGTAASGLPDLVKQRKRAQYGVGDRASADPGYDAVGPFDNQALASHGGDFTPPEQGGFTGGQLPGEQPPAGYPSPEIAPGGPDPYPAPGTPNAAPVAAAPTGPTPERTGPSVPEMLAAAGIYIPGVNTPGNSPSTPVGPGNINDAFNQAMLDQLTKSRNPSLSDPGLKSQADAYSVGQQRTRDQARAALAERLAANGISDSGAMDQGVAGLFQTQGENQGAFNAKLVGDELQNQRSELLNYMQLAGNRLTAQETQALQLKLADIDAELRRQAMTNQADQFGRTQGWNEDMWSYLANQYPQQQVMAGGG